MSFIQNIQKKPQSQKLAIMWAVAGVVAVLLVAVWIISSHFHKSVPEDTTLFQTLGKGIEGVRDNYKK